MSKNDKAVKQSEIKIAAKFGIPLTLLFLVFLVENFNPFLGIEKKWWDIKFSGIGHIVDIFTQEKNYAFGIGKYLYKKANEKIVIAAIDEDTTRKYGWPFKRRYYGELFGKLNKLGAKVIAVDVFLFDPDKDNPENDRAMVRELSRYNNIINLVAISRAEKKLLFPIKGVIENSRYISQPHADITMDKDGHIRKMSPFYPTLYMVEEEEVKFPYSLLNEHNPKCKKECQNISIPLLGAAAYAIYKDIPLDKLYEKWKEKTVILNFRIPIDRPIHPGRKDGGKVFNFSVYRHISIKDILEGTLSNEEKDALNGGMVFVGATAAGAFDHFPSPYLELMPGVEFHANLADNLLHEDYLRPVNPIFEILLMICAIWVPILMLKKSPKVITLISILLAGLFMLLCFYCLKHYYDIYFATFFIALFISYAYVMAYKSIVEGKEKRWIKNTFSQYLSPKVVNVLTEDPSKLTLGGEKRDMTVFFLDIAGFTSMSEKMTPEELTKLLNIYLSELTDIILKYDGVVDKYIGDCVMAFWNAPLDQNKHRTLACYAAIDCIRKIKELNEKSDSEHKTSVRIGINSGHMVVGNMGSNTRFSYTVLGDNVNLASRLEGANKFFHSKIMISEDVYSEAKENIVGRFLGRIRVVGKAIPVEVYEPLYKKGEKISELEELVGLYQKGIELFYKKEYDKSIKYFRDALKIDDNDGPSDFYLKLAETYLKQGDGDFDGVFNLTSK